MILLGVIIKKSYSKSFCLVACKQMLSSQVKVFLSIVGERAMRAVVRATSPINTTSSSHLYNTGFESSCSASCDTCISSQPSFNGSVRHFRKICAVLIHDVQVWILPVAQRVSESPNSDLALGPQKLSYAVNDRNCEDFNLQDSSLLQLKISREWNSLNVVMTRWADFPTMSGWKQIPGRQITPSLSSHAAIAILNHHNPHITIGSYHLLVRRRFRPPFSPLIVAT